MTVGLRGLGTVVPCSQTDSIPLPDGTCVTAGSPKPLSQIFGEVSHCFYRPSDLGLGAPTICGIAWLAAGGILWLLFSGGKR